MKKIYVIVALLFSLFANGQMVINSYAYAQEAFYPTTLTGITHVWYNDYNGSSETDGTAIPQWNDIVGSSDATEATNPPEFDTSTGGGQLYFNTTDFYTAQADGGDMDVVANFYIIIKLGGQTDETNSGCFVCKSTATSSTRQYQVDMSSTGYLRVYIGGTTVEGTTQPVTDNSFIIVSVSATTADVWLDGTLVKDDQATGSNTTTQALEFGGREGGTYNPSTNIQWIAMGLNSGGLPSGEVTALNALYDEN